MSFFDRLFGKRANSFRLQSAIQEISQLSRKSDMPRRIQLCQQVLKFLNIEKDPSLWAALQCELGTSLIQSSIDSMDENIEQAIQHYRFALEVFKPENFPKEWAGTQDNLAIAYKNRIRGKKDENIEDAISYHRSALKVYTPEASPFDWAVTQNNLGNSYKNRIKGDRGENIETAIEHFDLALKIFTSEAFPIQWAGTLDNLGIAYCYRIRGDRAENIEQAILYHEMALKIRTLDAFPEYWAMTLNNLAAAYSDRIRGERSENIEYAIQYYEMSLEVRMRETFPADWAMTQNNLGSCHQKRILGDHGKNIEKAIEHCKNALEIRTREAFPFDWAITENNLANAYEDRICGDRAENIEQAIEHYRQALKVFTPDGFPNYCRGTAYRLGNLYLKVRSFSEAAGAYSTGMEAAETLYRASMFQASKEAELVDTGDLYQQAGYSLANSNRLRETAVALERGRARGLGDALDRDRADLERVRMKDEHAYELYRLAVQELQSLEAQERAGGSEGRASIPHRDLMIQARGRLDAAVDAIRHVPGYEDFFQEPGWEDIAAAVIEGRPLVYIATAPGGGVSLVVHRSPGSADASVETVPLDGFSEERLQEHIKIWFDAYEGWQKALHDANLDYGQAEEKWFNAIDTVTSWLWQDVAGPVYASLQSLKPDQAFLIPTGLLALLPLHAAWRDSGGRREYLQDLLPVSYIPSARALAHARRISSVAGEERLLAIDEPELLKPSPLPSSEAEVSAISSYFQNPLILAHEKASHSAVLQALPKANVVHFSCHGGANWSDPEKSGLMMANDEILTIKDLFELNLAGARLVALSACETGIPSTKLPDEVISLPSAFIRAGFAGAIGSLWTVRDDSTALLMTSFYQLWREREGGESQIPSPGAGGGPNGAKSAKEV